MQAMRRRAKTIPAIFLAVPVWFLLTPIMLPAMLVFDLVTGRPDLPLARLWLFALVFCLHEWIGITQAARLWVTGGFGRRLDAVAHEKTQGWWSTSLLHWAERLLRVHLDVGDAAMPSGIVIVLSRHASMVDAIIPAHIFPTLLHRPVHYVMKKELQNVPNIDIYGHRLGNHFVDRSGDTANEVEQIAQLAEHAKPEAGLVIFPEGTYGTPANKERIGRSLARRGDEVAANLNDELVHLLPPKPAGTQALLSHCPDSAVVLLAHTGLEGVAEFGGLRKQLPLRHPVVVRWWEIDRSTIPVDPDEQVEWLNDQWRAIDSWVSEHRQY